MSEHYLAVGDVITERLNADKPAGVRILTATDLPQLQRDRAPPAPCVYVLHGPDSIDSEDGRSGNQLVRQRWDAVVVVRNVSDNSGAAARGDAGPLISWVLRRLNGWRFPGGPKGLRRLTRINGPGDSHLDGCAYYPLRFETSVITEGANE